MTTCASYGQTNSRCISCFLSNLLPFYCTIQKQSPRETRWQRTQSLQEQCELLTKHFSDFKWAQKSSSYLKKGAGYRGLVASLLSNSTPQIQFRLLVFNLNQWRQICQISCSSFWSHKDFIQLFISHVQQISSKPVNWLSCVKSVQFPFKCCSCSFLFLARRWRRWDWNCRVQCLFLPHTWLFSFWNRTLCDVTDCNILLLCSIEKNDLAAGHWQKEQRLPAVISKVGQ